MPSLSSLVVLLLLVVVLTTTTHNSCCFAQELEDGSSGNADNLTNNSNFTLVTGTTTTNGTAQGEIFVPIAEECDIRPEALVFENFELPQTCITVEGQERCWYTYTPVAVDDDEEEDDGGDGIPLVIDLHGYTSCATISFLYTGWMEKALQQQQQQDSPFVLVFPQGTTNRSVTDSSCWNAGDCCCFKCTEDDPEDCMTTNMTEIEFEPVHVPDVEFLRQVMVDTVLASSSSSPVKIDPTRIYVAGHSNGCMMAQRLAAELSDVIAAVCCHAGVLMGVDIPNNTYIPTPVWIAHGDNDTDVPYYGAAGGGFLGNFASALDNLANWATANQCTDYNVVNDTSGLYATHIYSGCYRNATVELVQLFGVEHIPYAETNVPGLAETDIDTTQLAKDFCFQYRSERPPPELLLPPSSATAATTTTEEESNSSGSGLLMDDTNTNGGEMNTTTTLPPEDGTSASNTTTTTTTPVPEGDSGTSSSSSSGATTSSPTTASTTTSSSSSSSAPGEQQDNLITSAAAAAAAAKSRFWGGFLISSYAGIVAFSVFFHWNNL